jgi:hypothetical protein
MCDDLVWSFDAITGTNWLAVLNALGAVATVATAVIALLALQNWKHQDSAKRKAEFLDTLIEATHTYVAEVLKPVMLLEIAKIGMASHVPTWESWSEEEKAVNGAIAYIEKRGALASKHLLEVLEAVQPSTIKLRSLAAKGQVFEFKGYARLQKAVASLTGQFDKLESFAAVVGSPTLKWEHPEVLEILKKIMAFDPAEMRKSVEDDNVVVLEFTGETNRRIYG